MYKTIQERGWITPQEDIPVSNRRPRSATELIHSMASPITRERIAGIPASPYRTFRRHLQTGDLLFASGHDRHARALCEVTGAAWSHVGLIVRLDDFDRIMLLEHIGGLGVRYAPLRRYFDGDDWGTRPYNGHLVVARHLQLDPTSSAARMMISYALGQLSTAQPWPRPTVIQRVSRALGLTPSLLQAHACSEFVDLCFRHPLGGAYQPFHRSAPDRISPGDIWIDPRMMPIRRLVSGV